jgi:hypothetical protein
LRASDRQTVLVGLIAPASKSGKGDLHMTLSERIKTTACPECGAVIRPGPNNFCWLCNADLTRAQGPAERPRVEPRPTHGSGFSPWVHLVTLAAVLFGALAIAPGLVIIVALLAAPSLVRARAASRRQRARGEDATQSRIGDFVWVLSMVVAVLVALGAALAAICFAGFGAVLIFLGPEGLVGAAIAAVGAIGCVAAVAAALRRLRKEGVRL